MFHMWYVRRLFELGFLEQLKEILSRLSENRFVMSSLSMNHVYCHHSKNPLSTLVLNSRDCITGSASVSTQS